MTERDLQAAVLELAERFGWRCLHLATAQRGARFLTATNRAGKGWPDVFAIRDGRVLVAELKSDRGKTTPEQDAWLEEFRRVMGARVFVWTPADWQSGAVEAALRGNAWREAA